MVDVAICIMLIMIVGLFYCYGALWGILTNIRKEIRRFRYSMVDEFEALHGVTDEWTWKDDKQDDK